MWMLRFDQWFYSLRFEGLTDHIYSCAHMIRIRAPTQLQSDNSSELLSFGIQNLSSILLCTTINLSKLKRTPFITYLDLYMTIHLHPFYKLV